MSEPHEVIVIGASGLVGGALMQRFGPGALGTYRDTEKPGMVRLDVTDAPGVRAFVATTRPRTVVHAAAWTHVDGCEQDPERSHAVNVEGVRSVAQACASAGARMIFLSTDYVFGDSGPHAIDEKPAPLNVYGRHKLEAEQAVRDTVEDHAIVRSCNVYGYQAGGKNFVMAVLQCGREGRKLRTAADQWGNPTLAGDLADGIASLARSDVGGVLHLAGPDYVDRPAWAKRAAEAFGLDAGFVELVPTSVLGQPARRPLRAGLDSRGCYERVGVRFKTLAEGLRTVAAQAGVA